jgi:hypothetical protein
LCTPIFIPAPLNCIGRWPDVLKTKNTKFPQAAKRSQINPLLIKFVALGVVVWRRVHQIKRFGNALTKTDWHSINHLTYLEFGLSGLCVTDCPFYGSHQVNSKENRSDSASAKKRRRLVWRAWPPVRSGL